MYAKLNAQLDRYQQVIEPLRRLAMYGIPALLGFFAGIATCAHWQVVLAWLNRTRVGTTDPQFRLDISFYLFELPFYSRCSLRLGRRAHLAPSPPGRQLPVRLDAGDGREVRISRSARIQLAITPALYLRSRPSASGSTSTRRWRSSTADLITGAAYADVNALIPGRAILAGIAAVVAVLFIVTAVIGRWRLPIIGTALLLVSGLIIGVGLPVDRAAVPGGAERAEAEAPYIQRNIDATREAYGVDDVKEIAYNASTDAEPGALRNDAETTANIRIIDPALVSPTRSPSCSSIRQYYQFARRAGRRPLHDRRQDPGHRDRRARARPVDQLGDARSWYNNTVVYTHGYGVVAAFGNQRSVDGLPVFLESGIPSTGDSRQSFEPRVYFGEQSPQYSIVGAPEGLQADRARLPVRRRGEQPERDHDLSRRRRPEARTTSSRS